MMPKKSLLLIRKSSLQNKTRHEAQDIRQEQEQETIFLTAMLAVAEEDCGRSSPPPPSPPSPWQLGKMRKKILPDSFFFLKSCRRGSRSNNNKLLFIYLFIFLRRRKWSIKKYFYSHKNGFLCGVATHKGERERNIYLMQTKLFFFQKLFQRSLLGDVFGVALPTRAQPTTPHS